jgi:NAD(P)-dependent dehydrogenase (short-subunit alcohol dehydrogenase family)
MTAQTTLITGANRGIGLELVRQHLQEGWQVFATCRTPESASELNALAAQHPENCTVLALDIADENT